MPKKKTLNIYEVIELLNKKIISNTSLIKNNQTQTTNSINEVKLYLLEELKSNIEETKNL